MKPSQQMKARLSAMEGGWSNNIQKIADMFGEKDVAIELTKDVHIDDLIEYVLVLVHVIDDMSDNIASMEKEIEDLRKNTTPDLVACLEQAGIYLEEKE
jgi:hypothetical protein